MAFSRLGDRILLLLPQRSRAFRIGIVVEKQLHAELVALAVDELEDWRTKARNGRGLVGIGPVETVFGRD